MAILITWNCTSGCRLSRPNRLELVRAYALDLLSRALSSLMQLTSLEAIGS